MMKEILLIEPNDSLRELVSERLCAEGFSPVAVANGTDALRLLTTPRFESVLLEWLLPDMEGVAVLRELRTRTLDTPVMVVSTRGSVADRVLALDSGADDYLLRPFHMDECMARVRRMVRTYCRRPGSIQSGLLCIADLTVDTNHHVATRSGKRIPLSAKACAILEYFAFRAGSTVSRAELEAHVSQSPQDSAVVPVYIHYLRKKVDDGHDLKLLRTVRSKGYVLTGS